MVFVYHDKKIGNLKSKDRKANHLKDRLRCKADGDILTEKKPVIQKKGMNQFFITKEPEISIDVYQSLYMFSLNQTKSAMAMDDKLIFFLG